jgi:RimJ/RimL family protein N-acetyltransferase
MDEALLDRCLWGNEAKTICGSFPAFLKVGLGLCLMENDTIACEAYATDPGDNSYEIGVITHEAYRRRGLATLTCTSLMAACAARGYRTSWSCHQSNVGSIATARKLGYQRERPYRFVVYEPP